MHSYIYKNALPFARFKEKKAQPLHCFSYFSGLNGVVLYYNFYDNSTGTHRFTFKSDSYLEVIIFLSSNLKRDLPYLISLSCAQFDNPFPENLTRCVFFCFSESKYKYINTDLNILTKVLHHTLHVHNKFIHNATHVTVVLIILLMKICFFIITIMVNISIDNLIIV